MQSFQVSPQDSFILELRSLLQDKVSTDLTNPSSNFQTERSIKPFLNHVKESFLSSDNTPNFSFYDFLYQITFDHNWQATLENLTREEKSEFIKAVKKIGQLSSMLLAPKFYTYHHDVVMERNGTGMEYVQQIPFKSWEGTISKSPAYVFIPKTIVGLQNLVKWAKAHNKKIRVSGYRHTSSDLFCDDNEILVSMLNLDVATTLPAPHPEMDPNNELQGIQLVSMPYFDQQGRKKIQCRIGAATCNYHFQDWVHHMQGGAYRWTLPANVIMTEITFGGSNAPICHGAGINNTTLSDLVKQIEFINANGELQIISDKDELKAAAGCFGLLGVVTAITLELDEMTYANFNSLQKKPLALTIPPPVTAWPSQNVTHELSYENNSALQDSQSLNEAMQQFIEAAQHYYYSEWFWFPLHNQCWVNVWHNNGNAFQSKRYPGQLTTERQRLETYIAHLANTVFGDDYESSALKKIQTRLLSEVTMFFLPDRTNTVCTLQDALHFRQGIQNVRTRMVEFEIPIPDRIDGTPDWSICQKAWWSVIETVYSKENLIYFPMRTTLEMRITGGSNIAMAPQFGNKRTCSIEILTPVSVNSARWQTFTQEVMDKWAALKDEYGNFLNIRPHWAKHFDSLYIRRDTSWLREWTQEQFQSLGHTIGPDYVSVPMNLYLKHFAYKQQIPIFMEQINKICSKGNYTLEDIQARFSNQFLDFFFSLPKKLTYQQPLPFLYQPPATYNPNAYPWNNSINFLPAFNKLQSHLSELENKGKFRLNARITHEKANRLSKLLFDLQQQDFVTAMQTIQANLFYFAEPRGATSRLFGLQPTTVDYLLKLHEQLNNLCQQTNSNISNMIRY